MGADTHVLATDLLAEPGTCRLASGTRYLVEVAPTGARVARLPGEAAVAGHEATALRGDRAWVPLLAAGHATDGVMEVPGEVAVGHPMVMQVDVVRDGRTITIRQTTAVRHISCLNNTRPDGYAPAP